MNTNRRNHRADSDETAQNILVFGRKNFGLAVAEYLTEDAHSVTFVSEDHPTDVADGVNFIHRKLSGANDIRALASEITDADLVVVTGSDSEALLLGTLFRRELNARDIVAVVSNPANVSAFNNSHMDCIDMPQLLAERIWDQYK